MTQHARKDFVHAPMCTTEMTEFARTYICKDVAFRSKSDVNPLAFRSYRERTARGTHGEEFRNSDRSLVATYARKP